jgi:hypothetical protein
LFINAVPCATRCFAKSLANFLRDREAGAVDAGIALQVIVYRSITSSGLRCV